MKSFKEYVNVFCLKSQLLFTQILYSTNGVSLLIKNENFYGFCKD